MAHASKTILVNRPRSEVFNFLADGLNNPKWRPAVLDISLAEGETSKPGAVYKQGVKGPMNKRLDADYQITELEPDKKITFQVVKGPARPIGHFALADSGPGTELTFTLDFQPKGFAKIMGPMIQKTMEIEVNTLENLKKYLEEQA